jgi:Protein of unknown function (DUF4240)
MHIDTFWRLVEDSLRHSPGRGGREAFLRDRLASFAPADIVQFQVYLDKACQRAYTWDLLGAAVRIFGGWCSDDGFEYFRLWLVGRGRDGFERAVAQSDALAGFPEIQCLVGRHCRTWNSDEEWPEWESLNYLAAEAYGRATGDDECAEGFYDAVKAQLSGEVFARHPAGERWDAHDETAAVLKVPTLARMFGLDTFR